MTRLLTTLCLAVLPAVSLAGPSTDFIKNQVAQVRTELAKNVVKGSPEAAEVDANLARILDPLMEFDKLSEKALGKHWATLNAAQRADFIQLFHDLVFESYMSKVRDANNDYVVDYESEEVKGQRNAIVVAVAKTKKVEIELAFHLSAKSKTEWVADDIVIDEVSLVENYREQFNKIIAEDGYDALLKKMREKLDEIKKKGGGSKSAAKPAEKAAKPADDAKKATK